MLATNPARPDSGGCGAAWDGFHGVPRLRSALGWRVELWAGDCPGRGLGVALSPGSGGWMGAPARGRPGGGRVRVGWGRAVEPGPVGEPGAPRSSTGRPGDGGG